MADTSTPGWAARLEQYLATLVNQNNAILRELTQSKIVQVRLSTQLADVIALLDELLNPAPPPPPVIAGATVTVTQLAKET